MFVRTAPWNSCETCIKSFCMYTLCSIHTIFVMVCFVFFKRMCAPVMVELEGETDPLQIAMKELK